MILNWNGNKNSNKQTDNRLFIEDKQKEFNNKKKTKS